MSRQKERPKGWRCSVKRRSVQNAYWRRRMDDPVFRLSEPMRIRALRGKRKIELMKEAIG